MRLLLAEGRSGRYEAVVDDALLRELYAYPERLGHRGFVRANMVSSVDGAVTGADGRSDSVSSESDREVFSTLRGLADVILVGAGTARVESYRVPAPKPEFAEMRARLGQASAPCLAVVTASGVLPENLLALSHRRDGSRSMLVVTTNSIDRQQLAALMSVLGVDGVVIAGDERVDLDKAVQEIVDRGMPRVLCEGGPSLLTQLTAAGRLDELCLTTSPLLAAGDGMRVLGGEDLPLGRTHLRLAHLLESDGTLLARWHVG